MDWIQTVVLALIQGITEFLPISSSAHLLFPTLLLGWDDQGLAFDVALHLGTLAAVTTYLYADLRNMAKACIDFLMHRIVRPELRTVQYLLVATLPLLPAGVLLAPHMDQLRTVEVIATTTVFYALLLWWADRRGRSGRVMETMGWHRALFIGLAQALALVPGTSRSGITMTAALLVGMDRVSAARFSFLLAIPAILASAAHQGLKLSQQAEAAPWLLLIVAAALAAVVALAAMHALILWLRRAGMMPFVVYRLVLGAALFALTVS